MKRPARLVMGLIGALLLGFGCGEGQPDPTGDAEAGVRVASFDFAESELLAELYAQALEAQAAPVVRLGRIGPREIVAPAMELDHIDVVPEYLGTALQYEGLTDPNPDLDSAFQELNTRLARRGLLALAPAPAEDKNVVVVTAERAAEEQLESISDLLPHAGGQRFGGPAECPDRPLCLLGLEGAYGLRFAEFVPQRSLAFTAEALRRGEIDVGLMFSTAAQLTAPDLVELTDDRQLQPAENVLPVVRAEAVERWGPSLIEPLDAVSAVLTTDDLRAMNLRVADGEPIAEVAGDWLVRHGLLDP